MATTSEVKSALDAISTMIAGSNASFERAKDAILAARNQLNNIPAQFADEIATIDGYVPLGAFETLAKDEKAKLQSEFVALRSALETALDNLGVSYS